MKSSFFTTIITLALAFVSCKEIVKKGSTGVVIGTGQMPDIASDLHNNFYVVYGTGDSIMYSASNDRGKTFSSPGLIAVLPGLAASHMRGPQVASGINGVSVIACNKSGDIFCYNKVESGKWSQAAKVNDVDTVAKEGLMALSTDGQNSFAVWLDLRDKHNKIFGASSTDGGKSWSKNKLIYASPDTTVCECCKPSVVVKGNNVYVMFRNWLHGSRDLYLIQSSDGGSTFGGAQKLGNGNWALNGCPMDGGGLSVQDNNIVQTVWYRQGKIFVCEPGKQEKEIGEGKSCTITIINNQPVYAWTENGNIICLLPKTDSKINGKGREPVIKPTRNYKVACFGENEKQIHTAIVDL